MWLAVIFCIYFVQFTLSKVLQMQFKFQAEDVREALVLRMYEAFRSHVTVDVSVNLPLKDVQMWVVFTALHGMQTRSSDEISVCPSVCPSVRLSIKRVHCDKTEEKSVQIFLPCERTFSLVVWEKEWLVGGDPFYLKFWVNRPALERNRRFWTNNRS